MSEYVYGYYHNDSDVATKISDGLYKVAVADKRFVNHRPMPEDIRGKAAWYVTTRRVAIGLDDPGFLHEFTSSQEANAFLLGLREKGFWVPDWILFTAS